MVSDGDSKAFNSVEHIYGKITVEKLDCVGMFKKDWENTCLTSKLEQRPEQRVNYVLMLNQLEVVGN